jgi:hypothetical protein
MSAVPRPSRSVRAERALDRLQGHYELVGRLTVVEEHRAAVRARLEQALGPELTKTLLAGLVSST